VPEGQVGAEPGLGWVGWQLTRSRTGVKAGRLRVDPQVRRPVGGCAAGGGAVEADEGSSERGLRRRGRDGRADRLRGEARRRRVEGGSA